ncbi:MAG: 30S ribosomal protein S6 [Patescibacteria group bacterium]|jgi:small subunit ribosomal protein S6|nr:30S ribosomal protein S6 [Patescibacteria group bacterium]
MYELLYIVPGPLTEKDLPEISKKVKNLIEKFGGNVVKEDNLGNKKLAYPIKGIYRGFYLLVNFNLKTEFLKNLNKELKLLSEILRHLIVKIIERKEEPKKIKNKIEESPNESKEEVPNKEEKIDLEKLGEKIDDLFKI